MVWLAHGRDLTGTVAAAQAGDQAAFDAIYDRFAEPLFHYLYARCGDAELAEELTGDLWVRVVERLPAFRFRGNAPEAVFAGWLYRIARNLMTDAYRRRDHTNLPLVETIPSHAMPLDARLIAEEEQRELCTALERLTTEQREVLQMRFIEERSPTEVARLTGRSEGAVKVMQHRALGALARMLGVQRRRRDRR